MGSFLFEGNWTLFGNPLFSKWDENGETNQGVFVSRRVTSSRLNTLISGWLFPGLHSHANFNVEEHDDNFRVDLTSDERKTHLIVEAHAAETLLSKSVFPSLKEASEFFEQGSLR